VARDSRHWNTRFRPAVVALEGRATPAATDVAPALASTDPALIATPVPTDTTGPGTVTPTTDTTAPGTGTAPTTTTGQPTAGGPTAPLNPLTTGTGGLPTDPGTGGPSPASPTGGTTPQSPGPGVRQLSPVTYVLLASEAADIIGPPGDGDGLDLIFDGLFDRLTDQFDDLGDVTFTPPPLDPVVFGPPPTPGPIETVQARFGSTTPDPVLPGTTPPPWMGELAGRVYTDSNANGRWDDGELPRVGQLVYIDINRNGRPDPDEPAARTDDKGGYRFSALAPGRYDLRPRLNPRESLTAPIDPDRPMEVSPGRGAQPGPDFGVHERRLRRAVRPVPQASLWGVDVRPERAVEDAPADDAAPVPVAAAALALVAVAPLTRPARVHGRGRQP
jgi:hypothetical protein